jgi:hypothetical protein
MLLTEISQEVPKDSTQSRSGTGLPKKSSAMPPDVRKAFGLPVSRHFDLGLRPVLLGRSPEIINDRTGSAERFRTSSGIAALDESLFGQRPRLIFAS